MESTPLTVERTLNAPATIIWSALTELSQIKQWYFDLPEFKPEVGFAFQFSGGPQEKLYLHLCKITEVIEGKKLSYSWRYDGYPGNSIVTFELFPELSSEGEKTRVKITHAGLETFTKDNPDFAVANFTAGWTHILSISLKEFVEKNSMTER